jgi:MFS family permease
MLAGSLLMFAASAPTLLSVGLAAELYGRSSVALAAVAFTAGSLLAPVFTSRVQRRRANDPRVWVLCAFGMTVGWVWAAWSLALLLIAQALSGLFMTSLEGLLDTSAAARAGSAVTGALARTTAGRALGSAAATAVLPLLLASTGLSSTTACLALAILATFVVVRVLGRSTVDGPCPDLASPSGESLASVRV